MKAMTVEDFRSSPSQAIQMSRSQAVIVRDEDGNTVMAIGFEGDAPAPADTDDEGPLAAHAAATVIPSEAMTTGWFA